MRKTIIYIIGAGRSGTTLMDVMLGNADGIFSCGELNRYPITGGIQTGLDQESERARFWKAFAETFSGKYDLSRQKQLHHAFEYHSGLLKRLMGQFDEDRYGKYQAFLRDFYALLFDSIDESIIVDSSKYPGRALALTDTVDYDLKYVYIKRDPVRVVKSFAKKDMFIPTKNWWEANTYYLTVNHLCRRVLNKLRKNHPVVEIRYEDLVSQPEAILHQIQEGIDVDLSAVIQKVNHDDFLQVGDLFAGNTMRMKEQIKLQRGLSDYPKNFRNRMTRLINLTVYQ